MTPDELWIDMAQFDGAHANRIWDGSAATDDAPAWYGQVATLLRVAAAPATDDELAGESDIVARMQAAILDPALDEELAGESDIVARMQAAILELPEQAGNDDAGDSDRPRHLRAAGPSDGARRRQGVRVVRRIVALKAAAVTTVVAIGVTAAAATTGFVATVVVPALSTHEQKTLQEPKSSPAEDSGSSTDGPGEGDRGAGDGADDGLGMDPEEPLACMLDLDCLLQEVEKAAAAPASEADAGAAAGDGASDSGAATAITIPSDPSPATTLATESPPETTTTTTEPQTTTTETTTTTTSTTTTTTPTEPPPGDAAALPPADTLSDTGDTGRTAGALHRASRP
jgi:hypothetical protein